MPKKILKAYKRLAKKLLLIGVYFVAFCSAFTLYFGTNGKIENPNISLIAGVALGTGFSCLFCGIIVDRIAIDYKSKHIWNARKRKNSATS